ncbi:MAG: nodulation S family protein [Pyrinomonadaceae bacterium]|nr:nodulation S family protein [Pyrinomonadaceae bacterium]
MNDEPAKNSLAPEYFEDVYNANDDPWNFAASEYETRKYAATIAALPFEKYEAAFEIGCSIGVLTAQLAEKCESLLAIDVNEKALRQARQRCRNLPNVQLKKMQIPGEFPDDKNFDLIVVSEVGYYLSVEDWRRAREKIIAHLKPNGSVVLVHWTHFVADYPQTGDAVHDSFAKFVEGQTRHLEARRTEDYRLDVWAKL